MNDVAVVEQAVSERPAANLLDVIRFAVESPQVDVAKLRELVELQERMETRSAKVEFDAAMSRLQAVLPRIREGGKIVINGQTQSRYALYEDIDLIIRPLLTAEGFSISFDSDVRDGQVVMSGTLAHRLGHRETKKLILPIDKSGNKNATQAMGSTLSYGKRYLLALLLNIVTVGEDDDGQGKTGEPISTDQAIVINDLLRETTSDLNVFLKWIGAPSVESIPRRDYAKAVDGLNRKKRK